MPHHHHHRDRGDRRVIRPTLESTPDRRSVRQVRAHPHYRRHILGLSTSVGVMLLGSGMALSAHGILALIPIPHVLWDASAYFLHAAGAIPALHHVERIWSLFYPD